MAAKRQSKKYDEKKAKVWGSPDYLMMKFDDIRGCEELSRFTADVRRAKAAVKKLSGKGDKLAVYKAYRAKLLVPGEVEEDSTILHVSMGLNGGGRQQDYFRALQRLTATGEFHVFDMFVDAIDDLMDALCTYCPSKGGKGIYNV